MKIITIEEEAWKQLNSRINAIADYLKRLDDTSYDDLWLNNHEVCQYLHISEKTLWRMRTKGEIAYSKIYGQYFYAIGAFKDMLNANAIQGRNEFVLGFMAKGRKQKNGFTFHCYLWLKTSWTGILTIRLGKKGYCCQCPLTKR